jgi:hypothetical protein
MMIFYRAGSIVVRVVDIIDSRVFSSSIIIGSERNAFNVDIDLGRDIIAI